MTPTQTAHIHLDERGRAWIDDTNVKVIEVVVDKIANGGSPEEIHEQFPHLSVAQVYAALACYHDHKDTFDAEIDRQYHEYLAAWKAQGKDTPVHQKLRALTSLPL